MQSNPIFIEQYDFKADTGKITIWHDGTPEVRDINDFCYYCHTQGLYSFGSKQSQATLTLTQTPRVAMAIMQGWLSAPKEDDLFSGDDVTEVSMGPATCQMYELPAASLPPGVVAGSYEHNLYNRYMESQYGTYQENRA